MDYTAYFKTEIKVQNNFVVAKMLLLKLFLKDVKLFSLTISCFVFKAYKMYF